MRAAIRIRASNPPHNRDDIITIETASSLDEACGIQGFVTPIILYSATLHTGYVSKLPVTNEKLPPRKISC